MKRNFTSYLLSFILAMLVAVTASSQENDTINTVNKSVFIEFGGAGLAVTSANYDFRFRKGRTDGLGMRIGIGWESLQTEPFLGEGYTKTKLFSVPLEINYLLGKRNTKFEIGFSLTYASETENRKFRFFNSDYTYTEESGNFVVSYLPVGMRFQPKTDGFMFKFNMGPIINYSAPNVFSDDEFQYWIGLAAGYAFH
ncbi:hypothetical protein ACUNWD_00600 [Sunxiuqinia sp. A32]|uniref:hypothetical protein n=1 Tax=Sunxiuqinia sp. A32 TaxID=3461496 RepID=UPI0040468021